MARRHTERRGNGTGQSNKFRYEYRIRFGNASSFASASAETRAVAITADGLKLGAETVLVRFEKGSKQLSIATDSERCLALLSVACAKPVSPEVIDHLQAAAKHWQSGEPALANLRLVFARLPQLQNEADLARVRAAEFLLDAGMPPGRLVEELGLAPKTANLLKYDQNEPPVPAGQGDKGGEWTRWLQEPVPVYDQDTGIQVGTQSRARAIATNPLTVGVAGAAALLGGEAAVDAAVIAWSREVTLDEAKALLPKGMSVATFGRLAGFAQGLLNSAEASTEATPMIIERLSSAGVTRECVTAFRQFYASAVRSLPRNLSAAHRVRLLLHIERKMK